MGNPAHRSLFKLAPRHGVRNRRRHGFSDDCDHLYPSADHIENQRGRSQGRLGSRWHVTRISHEEFIFGFENKKEAF